MLYILNAFLSYADWNFVRQQHTHKHTHAHIHIHTVIFIIYIRAKKLKSLYYEDKASSMRMQKKNRNKFIRNQLSFFLIPHISIDFIVFIPILEIARSFNARVVGRNNDDQRATTSGVHSLNIGRE